MPCEIEEDCEEADISLNADDIPLPEGRTTMLWNAVRAILPWATGIGAALIILVAAGWTAWRFLLATPKDARSTYRRLRRLGRFAALAPAQHQTPHQWAATVLQALPEQRSEVLRIVDAYTLSTYSGRASEEPAGDGGNHVADAWNTVRFPLLWYALRRREA